MNKHVELVLKWSLNQSSVSVAELQENLQSSARGYQCDPSQITKNVIKICEVASDVATLFESHKPAFKMFDALDRLEKLTYDTFQTNVNDLLNKHFELVSAENKTKALKEQEEQEAKEQALKEQALKEQALKEQAREDLSGLLADIEAELQAEIDAGRINGTCPSEPIRPVWDGIGIPPIGSIVVNSNQTEFVVELIVNEKSANQVLLPVSVVYRDKQGNTWGKSLKTFLKTMEPQYVEPETEEEIEEIEEEIECVIYVTPELYDTLDAMFK